MNNNKIPGQIEGDEIAETGSPSNTAAGSSNEWMKLAKDAYSRSTNYFDQNYRKSFEDGLRLFNSQHPRESKYNSDAYKYRSRIFRPKTRSVIRKHEATLETALFSNPDIVSIDPVNEESDTQIVSAAISKELLNYRLTKSIPWFLTCIGAFQDAMNVGICASFQYWDYATRTQKVKKTARLGELSFEFEIEEEVPIIDKPCCELIPVQNIRFDPAAKWYDVVGTSPYLILELPMYLRDVLDRMEQGYGKGEAPWKQLDKKTLLQARITEPDQIQQARDSKREDPQAQSSTVNEFDVVMVHLNFIKTADGCFAYYTLKDKELLSEPAPIEDVFLPGKIPVVIGFCVIEAHKPVPNGLTHLGAQVQSEANEIANQRLDNVKFVLNKRWVVRRGSNIDVESMLRNVPGGVTMANDVEKDVREINWADVTSSSYQEQDRINADFDGLLGGGLDQGSVMTNRRLNETVGGMRLMAQGANQLTEYTIRIFVETWVEPVLRQLIELEQHYESDEVVLAIAAQKAGQYERFRMSPDLDKLLKQELTLSINVGMGATDPDARFQRFSRAMGTYAQMAQMAPPNANLDEIRAQLFGLAGFRDSKRFFDKQVDPRWAQARQMLQKAESIGQEVVNQSKDRILRGQMQLERKAHQLELRELAMENPQQEMALEMQKLAAEFQMRQREQNFEFMQAQREANQELALERFKAKEQANIAWYNAQVDAAVARFKAVAQAKAQAEAAKHAPKPQEKKAA